MVSVNAVCMSWVSCTAWKGLAEETQGQFLAFYLSSPSQCWETCHLFRKATEWRWGIWKRLPQQHQTHWDTEAGLFSCRLTDTQELTGEFVSFLEIRLEHAYQSGLLKCTWLEAPPSTAPLLMVNCCHCQSTDQSSNHAPAPGISCWGGKVEMKFPLTHSCSLRVRGNPALCKQLPKNPSFSDFIPW